MLHADLISYLRNGLLQDVRGVEILLKLDGKSRFDAPCHATYNEYCHEVGLLCNAVMQEAGPHWRLRHYMIELDRILVTFEELAKTQRQPKDVASQVKLWGKVHAVDKMPGQVHDAPIVTRPGTTVYIPDLSFPGRVAPSFPMSFTSPSRGRIATDFSALPTSVELPADSSVELSGQHSSDLPEDASPSALSPSRMVGSLSCKDCPQVFKGSRDARANLKRHRDDFHKHIFNHICTVPNCGKAFARSDYLLNHRRKSHCHVIPRRSKTKSANG